MALMGWVGPAENLCDSDSSAWDVFNALARLKLLGLRVWLIMFQSTRVDHRLASVSCSLPS